MMYLDRGGCPARRPLAEDIAKDVLDLLSRLRQLLDEQPRLDIAGRFSDRLVREYRCLVTQSYTNGAIEEMRALGADSKMIMSTLQVAIEALGERRPLS